VAQLVEDGATLQMGIGVIPDAVLAELTHHKKLGIHTEMFSDGIIDLVERGVPPAAAAAAAAAATSSCSSSTLPQIANPVPPLRVCRVWCDDDDDDAR
jgi:acyl-CoA hydrolase